MPPAGVVKEGSQSSQSSQPSHSSHPAGPHCNGCVNQPYGQRRVEPDGHGTNGIMFVGDSPWVQEIAAGRGFAGASGSYLERTFRRLGFTRQESTITNSLWCKPPHLGWTDHIERFPDAIRAMQQCSPYLDNLIRDRQPKVIVALGGVALRRLCDIHASIEDRHAYVHQTADGIPVIPTFHPSYVMQGQQKLTPCLMFAIKRAQEIASGTFVASDYRLLQDPHPDEARQYVRESLASSDGRVKFMMVDIETPESANLDEEEYEESGLSYKINRAGFSLADDTAISFPWEQPYIAIMQEALDHADMVGEWADDHFDSRRLRANGIRISGRVVSGMWAWHFLQSDLRKGLGFVAPFFYRGPAFKHLSSVNPALYNAMDNATSRACTLGSMTALSAEGRLDRFMRHCVEADRVFGQMGSAGVMIDVEQRTGFMSRLERERDMALAQVQQEVPVEVKRIKKWKRKPKLIDGEGYAEVVIGKRKDETIRARVKVELMEDGSSFAVLPFNVNAAEHIKDLIRSFGLKVPKARGENRETTDAKYLRRFGSKGGKYSIFRTILDCKQRGKIISTYNWPLDSQNRVHTHYGWHPSTWRKSSRNVNMQNIPKRSDLADEFRRMLVASPGHVLIETDSSAIEAVLVGYAAHSPAYINLAKAGVHGWLTSHIVGQPIDWQLPADQLAKACKAAKKLNPAVYEAAKRCIHGSNYLLSPFGMSDEYQEFFPTEAAAAAMQKVYFSLPPGREIQLWQRKIMTEAHERTCLRNHFDYKHYFYSVFKWNASKREWEIDLQGDAKRAVAFIPQSDASAIQTETILRLAAIPKLLGWLRLIIHDSVVMEVPEAEADYAAGCMQREHMRPIPELGGLVIGAETKVGRNLGSYSESNPEGMREIREMVEIGEKGEKGEKGEVIDVKH